MFQRDGFDVHSNVHVSFTQAILGGEVKTSGLSGPIVVKVWSAVDNFGYFCHQFVPSDSSWGGITPQNTINQQGNPQTK